VLYEAHVKGLTQCHPAVPEALRGRYAGVASPAMLAHYQRLGITTLCLLPVHLHLTEAHLLRKGLSNYWGYNTLGYFIPEPSYASGETPDARTEFRYMVDQLHQHGLEVVLDVVFNHSAEGDALGPSLSWRGLDNASWYRLDDHGHYRNDSGCGNSLDLAQPCAVQLVMDSLRWWVQAFGVDGFRFDLATALGRDPLLNHDFHPASGLLTAIGQDPVLAGVKLIAEPWDVGSNGYQLGRFPAGWAEWNDRFRDSARAFWLGFEHPRGEFARRLTGSSDVFKRQGRGPLSGINLITAHDGMTLADLTAYQHKHNEANHEGNRDGHNHNLSANAGVEGPTTLAPVLAQRGHWRRALLSTLLCAQGVPQLLAGDEFGQTQQGNNNAYCQDSPISWLNWCDADQEQIDFVAALVEMRQNHAALRHAQWFTGGEDIAWRNPDGSVMTDADWVDPHQHSVACLIQSFDEARAVHECWLLVFNPGRHALTCVLPPGAWRPVLDSAAALVRNASQWALVAPCVGAITVPPHAVFGMVQA
jgi:glycogen operon protein